MTNQDLKSLIPTGMSPLRRSPPRRWRSISTSFCAGGLNPKRSTSRIALLSVFNFVVELDRSGPPHYAFSAHNVFDFSAPAFFLFKEAFLSLSKLPSGTSLNSSTPLFFASAMSFCPASVLTMT